MMKNQTLGKRGATMIALCAATILFYFGAASIASAQRLTADEVVARHLASIGTAEARAAARSRVITGTSQATFRAPATGQIMGRAVIASDGDKNIVGMAFSNVDYPRESAAFDGNTVTTSFTRPGIRSSLGDFLLTHDAILKQGLMGGTLSTAWPLLNLQARGARVEYGGMERVGERQTHVLRYLARGGGSNLQIKLFFDQTTFQHIRTEYRRVIDARTGLTPEASARQRETRYTMIEDFSSPVRVSNLTLPRTYKISLTLDTQAGTFLAEWLMNFTRFAANQQLDAQAFNAAANISD